MVFLFHSQGLATAPVLFAAQKHGGMTELIARKFSRSGDVEQVILLKHKMVGRNTNTKLKNRNGFVLGFFEHLRKCDKVICFAMIVLVESINHFEWLFVFKVYQLTFPQIC